MKLEARYSDSLILHPLSEWSLEDDKLIQKITVIDKVKFKVGNNDYSEPIELHDGGHQPTFKMGQLIRLDGIVKYIVGIEAVFLLAGSQKKVVYQYTLCEEEPKVPIWWSTDIKLE